jgi:hypothetical protein
VGRKETDGTQDVEEEKKGSVMALLLSLSLSSLCLSALP